MVWENVVVFFFFKLDIWDVISCFGFNFLVFGERNCCNGVFFFRIIVFLNFIDFIFCIVLVVWILFIDLVIIVFFVFSCINCTFVFINWDGKFKFINWFWVSFFLYGVDIKEVVSDFCDCKVFVLIIFVFFVIGLFFNRKFLGLICIFLSVKGKILLIKFFGFESKLFLWVIVLFCVRVLRVIDIFVGWVFEDVLVEAVWFREYNVGDVCFLLSIACLLLVFLSVG